MLARPANLLLITSATILSYVCVLAGEAVIPFFSVMIRPKSFAELLPFVPPATLFAHDHVSLIVGLLGVTCLVALLAVLRLPGEVGQCVVVGLCGQWLIGWGAAFCFCYEGFLSEVSMHHSQHFEFDYFVSLAGGIFPVSLVLILLTLLLAFKPNFKFRRVPDKLARPNPVVEEIRRRLGEAPFHPFAIVTGEGTKYHVPSRAHVSIGPRGTRMAVWSSLGGSNMVAAANITRLEEEPATSEQTT